MAVFRGKIRALQMPSGAPSKPDQMREGEKPSRDDPIRSFGRRRGKKLRPGQERLLAEFLPTITFDPSADFNSQFGNGHGNGQGEAKKEIWMEIGFGGGEHLAAQADLNPDIGFIGCEPFINGVVKLASQLKAKGLKNVRVWADDVRMIFDGVPDQALSRVFILFPDPWPKKRHSKRRLLTAQTLDQLARMMKPGAELRIASDHADYVRWALGQVLAHPAFAWTAESVRDWKHPPADWVETRYQQKARARGIGATFLIFRRRA